MSSMKARSSTATYFRMEYLRRRLAAGSAGRVAVPTTAISSFFSLLPPSQNITTSSQTFSS